ILLNTLQPKRKRKKILTTTQRKIFNAASFPKRTTVSMQITTTQKYSPKLFNLDQLTRIRETAVNMESLEEQLLLAIMLSGTRNSQFLPMKIKDLEVTGDGLITVKGVSIPFPCMPATIESIKRKSLSKEDYVFRSSVNPGTHMNMRELSTRFRKWLKKANVDTEGATPHNLRLSVIIAYAAAPK
ncbi:tyrosine-type recombinase/integrase, partial [Pseudomonas sp. MPR-ANB1]